MNSGQEKEGSRTPYVETFDDGPGGWVANRYEPLPVWDGAAHCFSPWYVDANHAPPGAGYLHMLMWIHTKAPYVTALEQPNRFVLEGKSRDLTNARLTVRLRGELSLQADGVHPYLAPEWPKDGAATLPLPQLCLLVQTESVGHGRPFQNIILPGQPLRVTRDRTEQTVTLTPDPTQWTQCGMRHDLTDRYGPGDIPMMLKEVSVDLIFVLFPLNVVPVGEVDDLHRRWADKDYRVDPRYLPRGLVVFDTVRIDYSD